MDLDTVADDLYSLPLGEFTAARNAYVKQARADGDRDLAAEIQQLSKPTASARLVNQLARQLGDELEPLIELGRELREASANVTGEELRALTRQRHQVVHALVQRARKLGAADGHRVSEDVANEVRQTLEASLADAEIADAVLSGRLSRAAQYAGFGEPTGIAWHGKARRRPEPATTQTAAAAADVADLDKRRREQAERAVTRATTEMEEAQTARDDAAEQTQEAAAARDAAQHELERLRAELEQAERSAVETRKTEHAVSQRLERADRALQKAAQTHRAASARLADLDLHG